MSYTDAWMAWSRGLLRDKRRRWRDAHRRIDYAPSAKALAVIEARVPGKGWCRAIDALVLEAASKRDTGNGTSLSFPRGNKGMASENYTRRAR